VDARFEGAFELVERISDRREDGLAGGFGEMLRDSQHPAHGFHLDAQIEYRIEDVQATVERNQSGIGVQILKPIVQLLKTRFEILWGSISLLLGDAILRMYEWFRLIYGFNSIFHRQPP
jgi:hypothetical protein